MFSLTKHATVYCAPDTLCDPSACLSVVNTFLQGATDSGWDSWKSPTLGLHNAQML